MKKKLIVCIILVLVLIMSFSVTAFAHSGWYADRWENYFHLNKTSSYVRSETRLIQMLMNDNVGASLTVDGYFGSLTKSEVEDYQSMCGLVSDGIVGSGTWEELRDELIYEVYDSGHYKYKVANSSYYDFNYKHYSNGVWYVLSYAVN